MATRDDLHVEFDVAGARRYGESIATAVGAVIAVGIAGISYSATRVSGASPGEFVEFVARHSDLQAPSSGPSVSTVFAVASVALALDFALVLLVVPWLWRKILESQRCRVNATQIVSESGWLNRTTQSIPLDRIQDLSVKQGFLQRRFGVWTLEVQTAGSPSPFPELVLHAPKSALSVRDAIMNRRDALVAKCGGDAIQTSESTSAGGVERVEVIDALLELNRTMLRIEALLALAK
ncbi:hypothetical protein PybrP1_008006 [[Pythium] brassicae (nom. inval.)]|nr:hypothetical protein PybrP1_008006 [[Pythium] brassicae (nom. inval.)]